MNKSKLLKKSLAMVLAVMLVVAMIPLGASAASDPIWVNNADIVSLAVTGGTLEGSGTSYTDTLFYSDSGDNLTVTPVSGKTISYVITDSEGEDGAERDGGSITVKATDKKVTFYAVDADDNKSAPYTVTISQPAASSDTSVKTDSAKLDDEIEGTVNNSTQTITFSVPWGYAGDCDATFMLNNPVAKDTPVTASGLTIDAETPDTVQVYSQRGNFVYYTVKVEEMKGLSSLTIGGVSAVEDTDEDSDTYGKWIITLPEDFDLDEDYAIQCRVATLKVKAIEFNGTPVATTDKVNLKTIVEGTGAATLKLTSSEDTDKTYNLVIKQKKSNDASITGFTATTTTVNGDTAAYTEKGTVTGDKLAVLLPYKTDVTTVKVKFEIAEGATVAVNNAPFTNDGTGTIDLTTAKTVTVTAEDGTTVKYYQISATTADNPYGTPSISAAKMTIGADDDAVEYTGVVSNKTITFTVPYATTVANVTGAAFTWAQSFATKVEAIDFGTDPFEDANSVSVKSDGGDKETYTLVFKREPAKTGKTVSGYTLSKAAAGDKVATDNSYNVTFSGSKATVTLPYSFQNDKTRTLTSTFTVSEGAALYFNADATKLNKTPVKSGYDEEEPYAANNTIAVSALEKATIVVADETAVLAIAEEAGDLVIEDMSTDSTYRSHITVYEVEVKYAPAQTGHTLTSLTADDGVITGKVSGSAVEITVPYSYADAEVPFFAEYVAASMATVKADTTTLPAEAGEIDPDAPVAGELKVVGTEDPKIQVYTGTAWASFDQITVVNEDESASSIYDVTVKVAPAETGADVLTMKVNGVNASVNTTNKTVTATLPFGTELNDVTIEYTVSKLAGNSLEVEGYYDDDDVQHVDLTEDIVFRVEAEDGRTVKTWTLTATARTQFSDVKAGSYYYDYVYEAAAAGIVNGYPDGTFKPNGNITRRDFAVMLVGMLGVDVSSYTAAPFSDVSSSDYAVKQIAYLAEKGIVLGTGGGKYSPGANITRQEAARMIALAKNLPLTSTTTTFKDNARIASWAKTAVAATQTAGIFNGDNKGNFNPTSKITRADAAIVMVNSLNK